MLNFENHAVYGSQYLCKTYMISSIVRSLLELKANIDTSHIYQIGSEREETYCWNNSRILSSDLIKAIDTNVKDEMRKFE